MLRADSWKRFSPVDSLLNCVACYACMAKCPRGIGLTGVLLPLVKEQVLSTHPAIPAELQKALQNKLRYGNPMGESPASGLHGRHLPRCRSASCEDHRPVDVLWYVECYTSYHPRGQDNGRATAKYFTLWELTSPFSATRRNARVNAAGCPGSGAVRHPHGLQHGALQEIRFNLIVTSSSRLQCIPHRYPMWASTTR